MEAHVVLGNAGTNAVPCRFCVCPIMHVLTPTLYSNTVYLGLRVESYGTGTNVR
jgi:hypothetical protein